MKGVVNMWTRKSVKQKGKKSFLLNFWKCVLVALILSFILGVSSGSGSSGGSMSSLVNGFTSEEENFDSGYEDEKDSNLIDNHGVGGFVDELEEEFGGIAIGAIIVISLIILVVSLVITAVSLAIKYLLITPIEYGCRKFFRKNLEEPAKLSNIIYVFDSQYKNVVKTAFLTDLFIWLWSLLFIIPGIIKQYEYRMVPYIMSENPSMNFRDAQAESSKLMNGNKWKAFVLDLSFIGWEILSVFTFGILGTLYVDPYKASTDAALYEAIKYGIDVK